MSRNVAERLRQEEGEKIREVKLVEETDAAHQT